MKLAHGNIQPPKQSYSAFFVINIHVITTCVCRVIRLYTTILILVISKIVPAMQFLLFDVIIVKRFFSLTDNKRKYLKNIIKVIEYLNLCEGWLYYSSMELKTKPDMKKLTTSILWFLSIKLISILKKTNDA